MQRDAAAGEDIVIKLILPIGPSANRYWRYAKDKVYVSKEALTYREQVGWICTAAHIMPLAGRLCVSMDVYRPIRRGDLDNFFKVTIDSLKGYAYVDDGQITEIHAMLHDDKGDPRIEIQIEVQP